MNWEKSKISIFSKYKFWFPLILLCSIFVYYKYSTDQITFLPKWNIDSLRNVFISNTNSIGSVSVPPNKDVIDWHIKYQTSCRKFPIVPNITFGNTNWQHEISDNWTVHIFGAYWDNRDLNKGETYIRINGILKGVIMENIPKYCQIWLGNGQKPLISKIQYDTQWKKLRNNPLRKIVHPFLWSCPVWTKKNGTIPIAVSIVDNPCDLARVFVKVQYDVAGKKMAAVCATGKQFSNSNNAPKLREWIEILQMIGADKLYLYFSDFRYPKDLDYYIQTGFLDLVNTSATGVTQNKVTSNPFNLHLVVPETVARFILNDCLYRNLHKYNYVVSMEIGEVFFPRVIRHLGQNNVNFSTVASVSFDAFYLQDRFSNTTEEYLDAISEVMAYRKCNSEPTNEERLIHFYNTLQIKSFINGTSIECLRNCESITISSRNLEWNNKSILLNTTFCPNDTLIFKIPLGKGRVESKNVLDTFKNPQNLSAVVFYPTGGIGNQLFKYAAAYSLAQDLGTQLWMCVYENGISNLSLRNLQISQPGDRSYALNNFNIPQNNLLFIGREGCNFSKILDTVIVSPNDSCNIDEDDIIMERLPKDRTIYVISGSMESEIFFKSHKNEIVNLFALNFSKIDNNFSEKMQDIQNISMSIKNTESVAVHVRRVDFANPADYRILPLSYYKRAINLMINAIKENNKNHKNITFFIFSDDIEAVKKDFRNITMFGIFVFVSNQNRSRLYDFFLMSQCKHSITANSTFSWWAAYLNKNKDKIVIAPMPKFSRNWYKQIAGKRFLNQIYGGVWSYPYKWLTMDPYL